MNIFTYWRGSDVKIFALALPLLFGFIFSQTIIVSPIPIEVTKGVSVSFENYLKPSDLSEQATFTGNFGFNDHLLLKCAYITEVERNIIGGRYAFNEKMAVTFEHEWKGEDSSDKYGFAYKFNLKTGLI